MVSRPMTDRQMLADIRDALLFLARAKAHEIGREYRTEAEAIEWHRAHFIAAARQSGQKPPALKTIKECASKARRKLFDFPRPDPAPARLRSKA